MFLVAKARCIASDCWSWGFRLGTSWLVSQQLWLWSHGLLRSEWPKACGWKGFAIFCIDHPSFWAPKVNLRSIYHLCCFKAAAVPLSAVALLFEPHVLECADSVWPGSPGWQMKCCFHMFSLLQASTRAPAQGPRVDWSTGDSPIPGHHPAQENRGETYYNLGCREITQYIPISTSHIFFIKVLLLAAACGFWVAISVELRKTQVIDPQLRWGLVARGQRSHEALFFYVKQLEHVGTRTRNYTQLNMINLYKFDKFALFF